MRLFINLSYTISEVAILAQLVKLQDYASRYATDPYRYPGQYIRLKKENWRKVKHLWNETLQSNTKHDYENFIFKKGVPETENDLKQFFVDSLLPFQLKWASRTIREMSFLDNYYKRDEQLKYFLQRFPDTFLLMYHPIFRIKKAPVDTDHILIHPQGIFCIHILEKEEGTTIIPSNERMWYEENNLIRTKFLSPMISLQRTSRIIKNILDAHEVNFPITKLVLAPNNEIEANTQPYRTEYIGREQYPAWFDKMRSYVSPLKYNQLKSLETLLKYGQTTSVKRPEWEDDDQMMEE